MWRLAPRASRIAQRASPIAGGLLLVSGLALYVLGRSQHLPLFTMASHIPVIAGLVLMLAGAAALRALAFPILLLALAIPLPGFILDAISAPLKVLVSSAVAALLQAMGYEVIRSGVVLEVAGHPMLVADACSGMNSLVSLAALTLVYLHLTGPSTKTRIALLLASVAPIAVLANVVRVMLLALIAVNLGDNAANGPLHAIAGFSVFAIALGSILMVDRVFPRPPSRAPRQVPRASSSAVRLVPSLFAFLLIAGAALAAPLLEPVRAEGPAPDLEGLVPASFGDWSIDRSIVPVPPTPEVRAKLERLYGATLERTYVNTRGERIMLVVAYGGDQSDALKAHRQESCYAAQGFRISGLAGAELDAAGRSISATRLVAVRGDRSEPVTYWFTMGDRVVRGRLERLRVQLADGFAGTIPDGMLVRVSSLSTDAARAFEMQRAFVGDWLAAMPPAVATRFAGEVRS
jgi:EpsI family protein